MYWNIYIYKYIYIYIIYIYQVCVPLFENVKLQFFQQKDIFLFKTSHISVCSNSKTLRLCMKKLYLPE